MKKLGYWLILGFILGGFNTSAFAEEVKKTVTAEITTQPTDDEPDCE